MKIKNLFAILLALTLLLSTFVIPTSAKESTENDTDIEIIIIDEVSVETKEKIEKYFVNGAPTTNNSTVTYGLTCNLFGHKIEGTAVSVITHKVRATSPRCKREIYNYEACTRCDYETSELMATEYIICCS